MEQLRSKVLLVLLVLAVTFGSASVAMAQGVAYSVTELPRQIRFEGTTEAVGDVIMSSPAVTGTVLSGSTISVLYNATVRFPASTSTSANLLANNLSCAVNGAAPALNACNTGNISVQISGTSLTISFVANQTFGQGACGATCINQLDVLGIRVNANTHGLGDITATLSGVSANPATNPISFDFPLVTVATVKNSITAAVEATGAFLTCNVVPTTLAVEVGEQFPAAFATTAQEAAAANNPAATNGTTIIVNLGNVPNGFTVAPIGPAALGAYGAQVLVGTFSFGTLTFGATPASQTCSTAPSCNLTFTYTFTATSQAGNPEGFAAGFTLTPGGAVTPVGVPGITATASASIGPITTTSATIPRFASNVTPALNLFTLTDCITNLLFPFVTNQAHFDTGIAIANTSSDDASFGTGGGLPAQSGTCKLDLYPTNADGTAGTAVSVTTASVPSGAETLLTLSGTSAFAGKTGYVIGVCQFLGAHGFGFVVDGFGVPGTGISHGYLALIIPNPRGIAVAGEGLNE